MLRRLVTAALVAAFVCLGVVVPAAPVAAAGAPPYALPPCTLPDAETGGWNLRDGVATGTRFEDETPVRPRHYRLGEPCFDDNGFSDPVLALPVRLTDIPVDILDEDEDGEDDGGGGEPTLVGQPSTSINTSAAGWTGTIAAYVSGTRVSTGQAFRATCFEVEDSSGTPITTGAHSFSYVTDETGTGGAGSMTTTISGTFTGGGPSWGCPDGTTHAFLQQNNPLPWIAWMYWPKALAGGETYAGTVGECLTDPEFDCQHGQPIFLSAVGGHGFYGGTQSATMQFGAWPGDWLGVDEISAVTCSTSYSGGTETVVEMEHAIGSPGDSAEPPVVVDGVATEWSLWQMKYPDVDITESGCDYLVAIEMWVCTHVLYALGGIPQYGCFLHEWTAERWADNNAYAGPDGETPEEHICTLYPETPGCYEVINPPYVDGTDFDVACAGAPEPTWAVWDWLFPWVGHMVQCLFVPINGWDRLGWVETAWQSGAGGDMTDTIAALGDALVVEGGCGVILEGDVLGSDVEIDTCSWSWANAGRVMLYWLIIITGCFAAVMFLMKSIFGIIDGRTPTPFDEDK